MTWTTIRTSGVPASAGAGVIEALVAAGATAIEETASEFVTHLPPGADADALVAAIRAIAPGATVTCSALAERDALAEWTPQVGVQRLGRIAVAPPWRAAEIGDAECGIIIEPAAAFGTGEHETTRSVLRLLPSFIQPGDRVADLGAGSAVLAIAAAKLGASRVAAIEIDPAAVANAESNVARNHVAGVVTVLDGDAAVLLPLIAPVEVILANIISSVLLALSPVMRAALASGGRAVLSGLLAEERAHVLEHLRDDGWHLVAEARAGEWWSAVFAS